MLSSKEFVDQVRAAFGDFAGTWRVNDEFYIDPETGELTLLVRTYSCRLTPAYLRVKCDVYPPTHGVNNVWSISDARGPVSVVPTLSEARKSYLSRTESHCRVVRGDA